MVFWTLCVALAQNIVVTYRSIVFFALLGQYLELEVAHILLVLKLFLRLAVNKLVMVLLEKRVDSSCPLWDITGLCNLLELVFVNVDVDRAQGTGPAGRFRRAPRLALLPLVEHIGRTLAIAHRDRGGIILLLYFLH